MAPSLTSDGIHVPVAHSRHGDEGPPVGVQHRVEARVGVVVLEDVHEGGEHDGAHPQEQDQQAQLLVVCSHGVA